MIRSYYIYTFDSDIIQIQEKMIYAMKRNINVRSIVLQYVAVKIF